MGYMGDVKTKTFIDDNASSATFVAAAAQPTSTFTLAKSSFGTNTGRKITATTSGSGDGSKTITIVGTDVNGDALTEVITLPGSATTTSGTTDFFQTITSATVSAQPAANVSLGMTADVAGGVFAGRTRVRQANVGSGVNTNAPDDEELAVSFAIQNGEAAAKVMTLDYISAGKERTANTEL